jgi:S1-C subfamily serine protease
MSQQAATLAESVSKAVVAVDAEQRPTASGIHWKTGVVVTAAHLTRHAGSVNVILPDGKSASGQLVGRDSTTDIAVVRADGNTGLSTLTFSSSARLGELVMAVGRSRRGELAVSAGLLARVGGPWRTWRGGHVDRLLRPDVRLYPGQSGSVLVNGKGQALGVNSAVLARASVIALPVETVDRVVNELLERGHIATPYLGVAMQQVPVPEEWKGTVGGENRQGLLVLHVAPETAAKQAGIALGDLIVSLEGKPVEGYRPLHDLLAERRPGDELQLQVLRAGSVKEFRIKLGERPAR